MAEALAPQVAALSLEDNGLPKDAVFSIIASATFANFSIDQFVAATKATYNPREFPAAKLCAPDRGTFVTFRDGKVLFLGARSEAVAHQALADLASELRCTLVVAPRTESIPCQLPACHAVDGRMLTQRVPRARQHGSGATSWHFEPPHANVEALVARDGSACINNARSIEELRLAVREVQRLVQECAAADEEEGDA